jgi:hypothetical protein
MLDYTYGDYTALLESQINMLRSYLNSGYIDNATREELLNTIQLLEDALADARAKNPDWYIDPWGRFGIRSQITAFTGWVGFMGASGIVTTDAGEQIVYQMRRNAPEPGASFSGSIAIFNSGGFRDGYGHSPISRAQVAMVLGEYVAGWLLDNEGFENVDYNGPALSGSVDGCPVAFSVTTAQQSIDDAIDKSLVYSSSFSASMYQTEATEEEIISYFGPTPERFPSWYVLPGTDPLNPPLDPPPGVDGPDPDLDGTMYELQIPKCYNDPYWEGVY